MKEILKKTAIILDNHFQEEYVDEEFLQAIFDDVVEVQGTKEYVKNGFSMETKSPVDLPAAGYLEKEGKIELSGTALKNAQYEVDVHINSLPESKRVFATNLLLVTHLLHELEYVNQRKIKENDDSYEANLLRAEEGNKVSISTYHVTPSERFAEANSLSSALTILDNSIVYAPELKEYLEQRRNLGLITGYEDVQNHSQSYPIKQYMDSHGISHSEMNVSESVQTFPDLDTRLFYGMPITEEEYKTVRTKAGLKNDSVSYTV